MSKRGDKIRLRKAMTLLELVIAMVMITIVFAAVLPQFALIRNSWDSKQGSAEVLQNGRVLIDHINRNLSKAKQITAVGADASSIDFNDCNGVTFRYDVNAVNNYVEYGLTSDRADLAGPVSSLTFTCYDACNLSTPVTDVSIIRVVKVDATVTSTVSSSQNKTFSTWVYLRTNDSNQIALTEGTTVEFDGSSGQYPALAKIDSTHYLCAYNRSGNGYAKVLTVDPSTWAITAGTRYSLETPAASGTYLALVQIDPTRYLCAYSRGGLGYAVVLTVSGTTITPGTRYSLETPATNGLYPALAQIDPDNYLCAYTGSANRGYAKVLAVSGTTITPGTQYSLETPAATGTYPALVQIDSTRCLCAYTGGSSRGYAKVLTVSGTTITPGTRYSLETPAANGQYSALVQINSTHYLCAYNRSGAGNAIVLMVSGTTITPGTRYPFDASGTWPALAQIDSTRYLCAYTGPGTDGWAVVLSVKSSDWTISTETGTTLEYDTSNGQYSALAQIDAGNYLCAYTGQSSHGQSVILCTLRP